MITVQVKGSMLVLTRGRERETIECGVMHSPAFVASRIDTTYAAPLREQAANIRARLGLIDA